ncbi:LCP2 protein, partial [Polypterus senegalus]|nr:LCP2 protein [Polypterus senegalus]
MNFSHVPSRSEVTQWGPSQLADYLKSMNLKDCDKVVKKHNINGHRFLELSENDLQKFPKTHAPMHARRCRLGLGGICELSSVLLAKGPEAVKTTVTGVGANEPGGNATAQMSGKRHQRQKLSSGTKRALPSYMGLAHDRQWAWQLQATKQGSVTEDDDDYESPDAEDDVGSDGDYEEPTEDSEGESDNEYEPPPVEPNEEQQSRIHAAKPISNNADYIDNPSRVPSMKMAPSQPPIPPQRPGSLPGGRTNVSIARGRACSCAHMSSFTSLWFPRWQSLRRPRERSLLSEALGHPKGNVPLPRPSSVEKLPNVNKVSKPALSTERADAGMARRPPAQRPWAQDRRDEVIVSVTQVERWRPAPALLITPLYSCLLFLFFFQPHDDGVNVNRSHSRGPSDMKSPAPPQQPHRPNPAPSSYAADNQDLNPEWYAAGLSRKEAEDYVYSKNQDGAFLVRDSSKRSTTQPYVLMVLYQNKVFNIQIRYQEEQGVYLLGTGIKGKENFSSVTEIIEYHKQAPLLLIDGKDRGSGYKRQCCLTYPAHF